MNQALRLTAALFAVFSAACAHGADWSDASIGYSYGTKFKEPGSAAKVSKHIVTLQYIGEFKYGMNFFSVDLLKSDHNDLAKGSTLGAPSDRGAQEVYAVVNNTLSFGKLTGTPVKFGPIRDIGWQTGFDFNSKNDTFGAGLVALSAGPKLEFDVPGLLTLGVFVYKEKNNNGIVGRSVNFDAAARLGLVWAFDFDVGAPTVFKGFANFTGSKGKDGFGVQTAPETWLDLALMADVGSLAGTPKTLYAGVGYQYIRNKFGNPSSVPGTKVSTPSLKVEVHF